MGPRIPAARVDRDHRSGSGHQHTLRLGSPIRGRRRPPHGGPRPSPPLPPLSWAMPFFQDPPRLANTYEGDPLLRELLARTFSADELAAIEPELVELGALAAGPLLAQQEAERELLPTLVQWDAWGRRVDRIA